MIGLEPIAPLSLPARFGYQPDLSAARDALRWFVREGSERALQALLPNAQPGEHCAGDQSSYPDRLAVMVIALSSSVFRLSFRAVFTDSAACALAEEVLGQPSGSLAPSMARDTVGEFCNLAVGMAQRSLAEAHSTFGGMVLTTPMYFAATSSLEDELRIAADHGDCWALHFGAHQLRCSFVVDITDIELFSLLQEADLSRAPSADDGELEFF